MPLTSDELRLLMAAERTLLAWVRTGLAMMGFGFVVARFGLFIRELADAQSQLQPQIIQPIPTSTGLSLWFGIALVLLGVAVNLLSAVGHVRFLRAHQFVASRRSMFSLGVIVSIALGLIGIGMSLYLFVVGHS